MTDNYDTGGALVPVDDTGHALPADKPPLTREDLDLVGGSNVGVVGGDDEPVGALTIGDGDGELQTAEGEVVDDAYWPTVEGHQWREADRPILDSFVEKADEIGLSDEQRAALAEWFIKDTAEIVKDERPSDVSAYHFELVDGAEAEDNALISGLGASFKQLALSSGMSAEYATGLVTWFAGQAKALVTAQDAQDRAESVEELRAAWGSNHGVNVGVTQRWLNGLGEVGALLKGARTADGQRLIYAPGIPQLLHEMALGEQAPASKGTGASASSHEARLRKEAADLVALRNKDINAYDSPWRSTGMTGRDRYWQLTQALEAIAAGKPVPTPAQAARDLAEERRQILALQKRDSDTFAFGRWRNTTLTPQERLDQIATRGR